MHYISQKKDCHVMDSILDSYVLKLLLVIVDLYYNEDLY